MYFIFQIKHLKHKYLQNASLLKAIVIDKN